MRKIITYFFSLILFYSSFPNQLQAQFCSGKKTLTATSGTISDGSGSSSYQPNANCEWLIQPVGAASITLIFTEFDTEGCCDYVEVYDGTSSSDPLIGTYSGNNIPLQITSSGGSVYVVFYSDPTTQKAGWTAFYSSCIPAVTPTISNIGSTSFCKGDSVILISSKGSSYVWSTGATTRDITVKSSGSFSVFVTDSNACMAATAPVSVNSISLTVSISNVGSTSVCKGDSVKLVSNTPPGNKYQWLIDGNNISGATTSVYYADSSGVYSLKVSNGPCSLVSGLITIQVNPSPAIPTISASGPTTFCGGGSVVLTSSTASNYTWSNGATTKSITVTTSGNYTVKTSNGSCSSTSTPIKVTSAGPSINASASPSSICSGGKSNLNVNASPSVGLAYSWSPITGLSNPNIANPVASITATTTYQVTVTDTVSGCYSSKLVVVSVFTPQAAAITPTGPIVTCQGNPVSLMANSGGTYLWSNGATAQTIYVTSSNTYSVVVTYPGGCKLTSNSVSVTINPAPNVSISSTGSTTLCQGDSINLVANSTSASTYQWYNYGSPIAGATSSSYWAKTSGNYYVSITTSANCSATSNSIYITVNTSNGYITSFGSTTFCAGDSVELYFSGYGISYQWLLNNSPINGATSYSYYASASGSYTISVQDYNGCNISATPITVNVLNQQGIPIITSSGPTSFCNGQSVTLSSTPAGNYLWSNGATTQNITVTKSGTYSVTVGSPGSVCSAKSTPITIINSTPMVFASTSEDTICIGGTVQLDVSAGSSMTESFDPINNSHWSNIVYGTVGNTGCGSVSGNALYFDGSGTRLAETIDMNVTAGGQISFNLIIGNSSYPCEMADYGEDVLLEYSTDGGISWSNLNTYLTGGTYSSFTLVTETIPSAAQTQNTRFRWTQPYNSGTSFDNWAIDDISINGLSSSGTYTYSWNPSAGLSNDTSQSPVATVSASTLYTVTVTDPVNSCAGTSSVNVTAVSPGADISVGGPTTFCLGGYVVLTASPGTAYAWSNGSSNQSVTITQSGSYTVSVTSPYSCPGTFTSAPVNVSTSTYPVAVITANGPTSFCQGGSVILNANSGTSFQWSNGSTTQSIIVNQAGTYTVNVSNAGGCNGSASSAPVSVSTLPIPGIPVITQNGNTMVSSSTSGNQWYYNYQAISGATGPSYLATQNGVYSVLYTDANGCSSMSNPYTMVTGINENSLLENSLNVYPNPFSGEANIAYVLQIKTHVLLEVYNMLGAKISTIRNEIQVPGDYQMSLKDIPAGAYMLIMKTSETNCVRKILSMK